MEQMTTTAPATESAPPPQTTNDIVANVVAESEATSGTDSAEPALYGDGETQPAVEKAQEPAAVQQAVEELSAAAQFLLKQGHKAKREDGRATWLPLSTVEKMLDRYAGEQLGPFHTTRQAVEKERDELAGHLEQLRAGIMGEDTDAIIREFAAHNPKFQRYLQTQAAAAATEKPAGDDPEPEPDFNLGNGQKTYSLEGLRKREEWLRRQLTKVVDERLKPIADREKAEQERQQQDALKGKARSQMETAQSWPMFGKFADDGSLTPFQQEVLDELQKNKTATFREAYLEVYARHQEPDKVRERALADVKTARPAPALSRQSTESTSTKPRSTQDIVRGVLAEADRQ